GTACSVCDYLIEVFLDDLCSTEYSVDKLHRLTVGSELHLQYASGGLDHPQLIPKRMYRSTVAYRGQVHRGSRNSELFTEANQIQLSARERLRKKFGKLLFTVHRFKCRNAAQ